MTVVYVLVAIVVALLIALIAGAVYALYDVGVGALVLGIGAAYGSTHTSRAGRWSPG